MNKLGLTSKFPMAEVKKEIQLEIAHVLFLDIVGYSKRSINEQADQNQLFCFQVNSWRARRG